MTIGVIQVIVGIGPSSGSGAAGETVTVAVRVRGGVVRVEVTDRSGSGVPRVARLGRRAAGGWS
jgi:hypothetical protein